MKVLVTGANGQLGRCLNDIKKNDNDWIFTNVESLDITNEKLVNDFINNNEIDVVINCAAYTNVEKAEDEPEKAMIINGYAPGYLAKAIQKRNGYIIHISTDYVFGTELHNTPYIESFSGTPLGQYGITKKEGEKQIQKYSDKYYIIRTSWLYSEYGNNFLKTMIKLLNTNDDVNVIFDQVGTPTYAYSLAEAIVTIVSNISEDKCGIYNFSNAGVCSWYDFAMAIKKIINNRFCNIHPIHSSEFRSKVKRPNFSVLDETKIKTTFNIDIDHWYNELEKCIKKMMVD